MEEKIFSNEIAQLIRSSNDGATLKEKLSDYHENDIAEAISLLDESERKKLYSCLGADFLSDVFSYLYENTSLIEELEPGLAADIIENMDADDATDILDELEDEKRDELLGLIDEKSKEDIELIRSYGEEYVGSYITTNYISVDKDSSIKSAMKTLIGQAAENDNISTIYALNSDGSFFGAIDLKDLIIARPETELQSIVRTSYPFVFDNDLISEKIEELKRYSEDSIPVISRENKKMIGVITSQDIVEAVEDQLGEDYAKLAGLTQEEELKEPVFKSVKKRLPWLVALLFLGLIVSTVVGSFENVVSQLSIVICFQSLILDMAGNTGTQSLAVTIRIISDLDLPFGQRLGLIFKEMKVGLFNGLLLGTCSFLFIGLYVALFKQGSLPFAFSVGGCVALSLCTAMTISGIVGTLVPLVFKRLKIDPAVASGPFITTINDLVAVCVYYSLAFFLLIKLLGFGGM